MSGLLSRLIADEFTMGQIKAISRCRQCGLESLENTFQREICHNGTFCKQCIQNCPTCSTKKSPIPYLLQLLKTTKAKCQYTESGCTSILPFESLSAHEATCQYNRQKWPRMPTKSPHLSSTPDPTMSSKPFPQQKISLISKLNNDCFPNMEFVNQEAIQFSGEAEENFQSM